MGLQGLLNRVVRFAYFRRAILLFISLQTTVLLSIATLWLLADVNTKDVALKWGLWRTPDALCVGWAVMLLMLYGPQTKIIMPALLTFLLGALSAAAGLASVIWFGIIYRDCRQWEMESTNNPMYFSPSPDHLCEIPSWNNTAIFYIVMTCTAIILNLGLLFGVIGGLALLLTSDKYQDDMRNPIESFKQLSSGGNKSLQRDGMLMYLLNFVFAGTCFLLMESLILTGFSPTKHIFWVHIPQASLVAITFTPALRSIRFNRFARFGSLLAVASSCIGVICSILYFVWNCHDTNDSTNFGGKSECGLRPIGAIYAMILHMVFTGIGAGRVLVFIMLYQHQIERTPSEDTSLVSESYALGDNRKLTRVNSGKVMRMESRINGEIWSFGV